MIPAAREPNFDNLLKVLQCKEPERPTLFEFYLDNEISEKLTGQKTITVREMFEVMENHLIGTRTSTDN